MRHKMRKIFALALGILVTSSAFAFVGCGGSQESQMVLTVLNAVGNNAWEVVYKNIHPASYYTTDFDIYKRQMEYHAKALTEYLKGAAYEVVSEKEEGNWTFKGYPVENAVRVTLKITLASSSKPPDIFPFLQGFVTSGIADFIVGDVNNPQTGVKMGRAVAIDFGPPPSSHWAQFGVDKGDFASPVPVTVSDPDPIAPGTPSQIDFFEIFDSNYKHKMWTAVVETYTKTLAIGILDDGTTVYVRQVNPLPGQAEVEMGPVLFDVYKLRKPETLIQIVGVVPKNPVWVPYAKAIREAVAQAMKLFYIKNNGFEQYTKKFPYGLLANAPGVYIDIPAMETTKKQIVAMETLKGKSFVIIHISSCGSCRAKAINVYNTLKKIGMKDSQIIFLSKSPLDKLEDFPKLVGNSPIIIDEDQVNITRLAFIGTPSMMAVDAQGRAIAQLDNLRMTDSEINKILPKLTR